MPRVSAVVPTYNRAEYIEGAIETVFAQTYEDIEVVAVNDGSDDDTGAVLERYERDDRVQVIDNDENRGIAAARNDGIDAARGEFVCALDDDDRWHPTKVETQVAAMDRLGEEYAVICTWGENVLAGSGEVTHVYEPDRSGDIYPEILGSYGLMPHSSHMVRTDSLEAVGGYDTDLVAAIDWDVCIRLAREYRFAVLPEVLVTRIVHDRNISDQLATSAVADGQILEKYREEVSQFPGIEDELIGLCHQSMALAAFEREAWADTLRYSWSALAHDPTAYRAQLALLSCLGPRSLPVAQRIKRRLTARP